MVILVSSAVLAFACSLAGRFLSEAYLSESVPLVGSFVSLTPTENPGIAFGMHLPFPFQELLIAAALVFVFVLAWHARHQKFPSLFFGLIIGGAIANILDRLDDGFVTDFIQVGWWPTFNVADSCISIGVACLICWELVYKNKQKSVPTG